MNTRLLETLVDILDSELQKYVGKEVWLREDMDEQLYNRLLSYNPLATKIDYTKSYRIESVRARTLNHTTRIRVHVLVGTETLVLSLDQITFTKE